MGFVVGEAEVLEGDFVGDLVGFQVGRVVGKFVGNFVGPLVGLVDLKNRQQKYNVRMHINYRYIYGCSEIYFHSSEHTQKT